MKSVLENRIIRAWLILATAFLIHVIDEATTGFLPLYNHTVLLIREKIGFFPMPIFTIPLWIGLLGSAIVICYMLTPLVGRARRKFRIPIGLFAVIMTLNGCWHTIGSIFVGRILPGFWSSFLLILAGVYMILVLYRNGNRADSMVR